MPTKEAFTSSVISFYISADSADVWANPTLFRVDGKRAPATSPAFQRIAFPPQDNIGATPSMPGKTTKKRTFPSGNCASATPFLNSTCCELIISAPFTAFGKFLQKRKQRRTAAGKRALAKNCWTFSFPLGQRISFGGRFQAICQRALTLLLQTAACLRWRF